MNSPRAPEAAPSADAPRSEAELLQQQTDETGRAIAHSLEAIKQSLHEAGDVKAWMKRYPWSTVGVVAGAGLLLAAAFATRRQKANARENALLEKIVTDEQIAARLRELVSQDEARQPEAALTRTLLSSLLQTFGPAVQSAVTAAVAAKAATIFGTPEAQPASADAEHDLPPGTD